MEIPQQLKSERFILCIPGGKKASEKEWPTKNNYSYDEMKKKKVSVYGALCGTNNLMVIDCDMPSIQEKLIQIPEIRDTFTVKTAGKGLYHFYFHISNGPKDGKGFRLDSDKGERLLDLQGAGTYVVGPQSVLENNKSYEIVNPREISTISYEFLSEILKNVDEHATVVGSHKKKENAIGIDFDEVCTAIKERIKIKDLLPEASRKQNPTRCPLGHPSEGGQSFSYTDNVWHCFHCQNAGNVIQLQMKINNQEFPTARRELAEKAGLNDDFKVKVLTLYGDAKKRHVASELLAREIIRLKHIKTIRSDKEPEVWIYKEGIMIPEGRTYIREFIRKILGPLYNNNFSNKVIDKIITDTAVETQDFFINEDVRKLPVQNGILDLITKELEPFSPRYHFFAKLPVVYDPSIKADKTIQFIKDILSSDEDVEFIQELIGYCLYRGYKIEKAFMFLGHGRNGKGKLINLIERLLGEENISSVPLHKIGVDRFATYGLVNSMANLSGDLSNKKLDDTSEFKNITGQDNVQADRKFLSPITFKNYAKMIFACNELPDVPDDTEGFFSRWEIINFKFKYVDNPSEPHHKKIDVNILDKITTDKEMIGFLNWALEGYDRLMKHNKFSKNTSNEVTRSIWQRKQSTFKAFLMDEIDMDEGDSFVKASSINSAYAAYCKEHRCLAESQFIKNKKLNEMGAWTKRKRFNGQDAEWIWCGLKLKNYVEPPEEELTKEEVGLANL